MNWSANIKCLTETLNIHWILAFVKIQTYQEKEVFFQQVLSWHPSSAARQWMTKFCLQLTYWPDTEVQVLYSCLVLSTLCPALCSIVQFCPVLCGFVQLCPALLSVFQWCPPSWLQVSLSSSLRIRQPGFTLIWQRNWVQICIWPLHYTSLIVTFSQFWHDKYNSIRKDIMEQWWGTMVNKWSECFVTGKK